MRASGNRVARAASIAVAWAVQLTWLDADRLDDRDVAGAVALLDAARLVDRHELVGPTIFSFTTNLHHVWDGDPPLAAVARDSTGRVAGVLNVGLPHWDNTHVGFVHVTVDPLARRQSIGRLLFESGVDRVRAEGRTLVLSDCWADSAGVEFARAMGMDQASVFVWRRQDLRSLDWPHLDAEYSAAESRATGYELVRVGPDTRGHAG
jgi:GNAT superfamily N-acetyltransferase